MEAELIKGAVALVVLIAGELIKQTILKPQPQTLNVQSPVVTSGAVNFGKVLGDVGLILLLTAAGGLIVGMLTADANLEDMFIMVGLSNLVLGTIGFVISGIKTTSNRWQHLFAVAVGVWLFSLINVLLGIGSLSTWMIAAILILAMMTIGGAVASAIKR